MTIRITAEAADDLEGIWHYLSDFSEEIASSTVRSIDKAYNSLPSFPNQGQLREDISPNVRSPVCGKYLILYKIQQDFIVVLRIVHGARDLPSLFPTSRNGT